MSRCFFKAYIACYDIARRNEFVRIDRRDHLIVFIQRYIACNVGIGHRRINFDICNITFQNIFQACQIFFGNSFIGCVFTKTYIIVLVICNIDFFYTVTDIDIRTATCKHADFTIARYVPSRAFSHIKCSATIVIRNNLSGQRTFRTQTNRYIRVTAINIADHIHFPCTNRDRCCAICKNTAVDRRCFFSINIQYYPTSGFCINSITIRRNVDVICINISFCGSINCLIYCFNDQIIYIYCTINTQTIR